MTDNQPNAESLFDILLQSENEHRFDDWGRFLLKDLYFRK